MIDQYSEGTHIRVVVAGKGSTGNGVKFQGNKGGSKTKAQVLMDPC